MRRKLPPGPESRPGLHFYPSTGAELSLVTERSAGRASGTTRRPSRCSAMVLDLTADALECRGDQTADCSRGFPSR